jgi:hypothetical protein
MNEAHAWALTANSCIRHGEMVFDRPDAVALHDRAALSPYRLLSDQLSEVDQRGRRSR